MSVFVFTRPFLKKRPQASSLTTRRLQSLVLEDWPWSARLFLSLVFGLGQVQDVGSLDNKFDMLIF